MPNYRSSEPLRPGSSIIARGQSGRDANYCALCIEPAADAHAPLCIEHMIEAWRWIEAHPALKPSQNSTPPRRSPALPQHRSQPASVVYYVRRPSGRVKIGVSARLAGRLRELGALWGDVLAIEWGGIDLESQRHRDFAAARRYDGVSDEEFDPTPDLLDHISRLRETNGDPAEAVLRIQ